MPVCRNCLMNEQNVIASNVSGTLSCTKRQKRVNGNGGRKSKFIKNAYNTPHTCPTEGLPKIEAISIGLNSARSVSR
jgi:hypothetical protein